jgi:hypothetical protein
MKNSQGRDNSEEKEFTLKKRERSGKLELIDLLK